MQDFQRQFLDFVIEQDILRFGGFTLKSGRESPYFFNAGLFSTGRSLGFIGECYARAIMAAGLDFDLLFGPAYKGIPLATATAIGLQHCAGIDKPWCFNRKEAKDHGEGGSIVGSELGGDVLIVDDVITAGTAIREVMTLLDAAGARARGVIVALDRQEKGLGELSAIQEIEHDYGIPVLSIISLAQIVDYLEAAGSSSLRQHLPAMKAYQTRYGVPDRSSANRA